MAVHHEPGLIAGPIPRPFIFQFRYTANPGLSYLVQRSANLQDWTPISTNTAPGNPTSFSDNAAMGNVNFYRVQLLPNP